MSYKGACPLYLEYVRVPGAELLYLEAVLQLRVPAHDAPPQVEGILHQYNTEHTFQIWKRDLLFVCSHNLIRNRPTKCCRHLTKLTHHSSLWKVW